ncbi:MAG TPA: DUF4386 domain-containing protein [Candidatus Limnocylindrales bacterium]|nr:DUF4386 domain-containing protein [Candidatus Limnocylindrales bacterium]
MTATRKTALTVGVLFILTFITSIGAVFAYGPILSDPSYITGSGASTGVFLGAFLELVLIVTNIGCAIFLFPILKHQNEGLALGYVAERIVEGVFILIGLLSLLAIVTLRQTASGSDTGTLVTIGNMLRGIHGWTFLLGPSFCDGIGTGAILGYLMWRSGLVGKRMALFGLIGGPLLVTAAVAVLLGVIPQGSPVQGILTLPEIIWEAFLGLYLTFKGFKPAPILGSESRVPTLTTAYAAA